MVEVEDVEKFDLDKFSINARKLEVFSNGVNIEIFSVVERKIYLRKSKRKELAKQMLVVLEL